MDLLWIGSRNSSKYHNGVFMIGLALEGGGTKGSYQIGAYYAMKDFGLQFDGFCGTSIGAFNSAILSCGKEKELLDFWLHINVAEILHFDEEYVHKINHRELDFRFVKMTLKGSFRLLKNHGIETEGLERCLKGLITEEEVRNSKKDFGLCTVKLNGLKPVYLFKEEMKKNTLYDCILASCFLPIFRLKKTVNNEYYVDGGFYDNSPVNMMIDKGYTKIYVVHVNTGLSINITQKPKKEVELIYIKPSRSLGSILELNNDRVHENIYMGYYDTMRILRHLDGYVYTFKKTKDWYFEMITRNVNEKQFRRVQNFFHTKTRKETVIKAVEYVMEKEHINYYNIYRIPKVIRNLKRYYKKSHFIYDFIGELKFL